MLSAKRIPLKYILWSIRWDIFNVCLVSVLAFLLFQVMDLPDMPIAIPAFLGTAISLVLGFKLSHSYDRWWEARKVWGAIVNDSRSLVMQIKHFASGGSSATIGRMTKRQIAWCYSLGQSLRRLSPFDHVKDNVSDEEWEYLQHHLNVPLAMMNKHGEDLAELHKKGELNDYQQVQVDQTLVRLVESMGKAERIKNTVFPTTYRLFLHFFIYIFVVFLAVSMADTVGWWEIPWLIFITIPFFMLEKTAYYLQDPFENKPTDTPVTAIARTIDTNLKQLIDSDDLPEVPPNDGYYVM